MACLLTQSISSKLRMADGEVRKGWLPKPAAGIFVSVFGKS